MGLAVLTHQNTMSRVDGVGREYGGDDADCMRDGEAAHRARAHAEQNHGGDEGGDVRVEHRRECRLEAGLDRIERASPVSPFLADALIDEHVGVDRDTHGEHDAGDTRQGQREARHRHDADEQDQVHDERDIGEDAEQAIGDQHEAHDRDERDDRGDGAGPDRVGAEARADGALLDRDQARRKRTGAQNDCQAVGLLDGEIAGDLAGAAENRLVDARRADHFLVEDDGEGLADIVGGELAEAQRPLLIELEGDDRLVGARVKTRLGIAQICAVDSRGTRGLHPEDLALALVGLRLLRLHREGGAFLRRIVGRAGRLAFADKLEGELGRLADHLDDLVGVADTRQLHDDAVLALALNRGFRDAGAVDALVDDAQRLIDRLADAALKPRIVEAEGELLAGPVEIEDAAGDTGAEHTGIDRLGQVAQRLICLVGVSRLGDLHRDAGWRAVELVTDARLAQHGADVAHLLHDQRVDELLAVDLHEDVGAALEVEAERHRPQNSALPQGVLHLLGQDIGQRREYAGHDHSQNGEDFPAGEVQHLRGPTLSPGHRRRIRLRRVYRPIAPAGNLNAARLRD